MTYKLQSCCFQRISSRNRGATMLVLVTHSLLLLLDIAGKVRTGETRRQSTDWTGCWTEINNFAVARNIFFLWANQNFSTKTGINNEKESVGNYSLCFILETDIAVCGHPGLPAGGNIQSPVLPSSPGSPSSFKAGDVVQYSCKVAI